MKNHNQPNFRLSHPNLYRGIMTFACIGIGLGLNFIFTNPTFNPYHIPKVWTGATFLLLGVGEIIFLNFHRNLKLLRLVMSVSVGWMLFWGIGTSITFFQGKTSLQLFVLYMGLSLLQIWLLIEPFFNPITSKLDKDKL